MLLRSAEEADRLAKQIAKEAEEERQRRFEQAIKNNDKEYLYSIYSRYSTLALLKLLFKNLKGIIK